MDWWLDTGTTRKGIHVSAITVRFLCLFCLLAFPVSASADAAAGVDWLEGQIASDGAVNSRQPLVTRFSSSALAMEAFQASGSTASASTDSVRAFLAGGASNTTSRLARRILADATGSAPRHELVDRLRALQRADGGFGDRAAYTATILDTGLALRALATTGATRDDDAVRGGVAFLLAHQGRTGGWGLTGNDADVWPTVFALRGLQPFRDLSGVRTALADGRDWLLAERGADGGFGATYRTAAAILALAPVVDSKDRYAGSVTTLREAQGPDGSWQGDAFTTALAVQALILASQPQPNPDIGTLSGRVVAAQTGAGIDSAGVQLSGAASRSLETDPDGHFLINDLDGGDYTLEVNAPGLQPVRLQLRLAQGQQTDVGQLELVADGADDAGTLRGTVTDAATGEPLQGATLSVADRDRTTTTDGTGAYQFTGLAPGTLTVEAVADGFVSRTLEVAVEAGTIALLSPALTPSRTLEVSVAGAITDNDTGAAIAGATVAVSGADEATATTGADGSYSIQGLAPGTLTLEASAAEYRVATASIEAEAGTRLNFSPALQPEDLPPADGAAAGLAGTVVDSIDRRPIDGASVTLDIDGDTRTTETDREGDFSFDGLPSGSANLEISADDFEPASGTVELAAGVRADAGQVALVPLDPDAGGRLVGRAVAAGTGDPLPGTEVTVTFDTGERATVAEDDGSFALDDLPAEGGRIRVEADGFEAATLGATFRPAMTLDVGDVPLVPADAERIRPDLRIERVNDENVGIDAQTFAITGTARVSVANAGNQDAGGFRIEAFIDTDGDGQRAADETLLGAIEVQDGAAVDEAPAEHEMELAGKGLLRDQPITFAVDPDNTVAELDETNNTASTAAACDDQAPVAVDLAACLDGSGSIGGRDFRVQTDGVASAIADPGIVPRDGSVRLTVIQFSSYSRVEIAPTRITTDNAESLAESIRDIRFRSGGTSIHSCIATARNELANAELDSAVQVIDVSTDGRSSRYRAEREADRAREAGIDALNAIGVGGGVDRNLLESIAFPKPVGGDSGFVVEVDDFEQFGSAIADKIQRETSVSDPAVGGLRIVDAGPDKPIELSAVVGNAGQGTTPESLELAFYAGDPADGAVELERIAVPDFASGESRRLTVEVTDLAGAARVHARIESDQNIAQCSTANDVIDREVSTTLGAIDVSTDLASYPADAAVAIDGRATNTGSLPGVFSTRYAIVDAAGDVVAPLDRFDGFALDAGAELAQDTNWSTGRTTTGAYAVRARLIDASGEMIDEAIAPFEITASGADNGDAGGDDPASLASLRVQSDAAQYHVSDTVGLETFARNRSVNAIIEGAVVELRVVAPDATEVYSAQLPVTSLQPGGSDGRTARFALNGAATGVYTVSGVLRTADGSALARADDRFTVINDLARSIAANVDAGQREVYIGRSLACTETVNNREALPVDQLALRSVVVDRERGTKRSDSTRTISLAPDEQRVDARRVDTTGFDAGVHACVLQARIDGDWRTLDAADFRVEEPPIDIDAALEIGDRGRLLVLLDPEPDNGGKAEDPHGPKGSPAAREQREWLETRLDQAGWSYDIVTDGADFAEALRTDGYAVVALFNEQVKIAESVQRELVERVEAEGIGLVVAGMHDRRNGRVDRALGLRSKGRLPHVDGLRLFDSEVATADRLEFPVDARPLHLDTEGARILGEYTESKPGHGRDNGKRKEPGKGKGRRAPGPGLTAHVHGAGRTLDAGFDLLLQGTAAAADNAYGDLLLSALDHVHPERITPLAGRVLPLHLALTNRGIATPGRALVELPDGVHVIDPGASQVRERVLIDWPFMLDVDDEASLDLWIRLPERAGPMSVQAIVQTGVAPDRVDHETFELTVEVQPTD